MKIIISGKGGSGKSTISSLLAKELVGKGYRVLIVDADESNYGLGALLGMECGQELMDHLGGKKVIGEKMRAAFAKGTKELAMPLFDRSWSIDEIPADCISRNGELYLLQVGKVKHFGEGCACPMGGLSREFLDHLRLGPKDIAIIDTEAGVEHLGRGVEKGADLILAVLDPSYESIKLSGKIKEMAHEAGKPAYFILNKVEDGSSEKLLGSLDRSDVIAIVPRDREVEQKGLSGEPLDGSIQGLSGISSFVTEKIAEGRA
ncbi:ATP-binding protein [Methanomassiliicoccus luminyensis]|uniref:ATP-binding protein n=1 Tax=Methanomassiliicoccus luminyensis TaxID=1080712 RepID=UPI0004752713|nr:P-loop NTPase [Methanomassiliicoccus luminyensis]